MIYLELLTGFLKVGLFAFGGAYGAIPLIRDVVLSYGWLSEEELMHMIAVSESTPGPIMVNLATYVGNTEAGFAGAVLATLAVVLPSFIVILLLMAALKGLLKNKYFKAVLKGLKPCVVGIVLATGVYMVIENMLTAGSTFKYENLLLSLVLGAIMFGGRFIYKKTVSPVLLIIISAFLGVLIY